MHSTDRATRRPSLRRRLLIGLLGYVALLSVAVTIHGLVVNERAEQLVWQTLLDTELDHLQERMEREPGYRWVDTRSMALYDSRNPRGVPATLDALAPGVHDEVPIKGEELVVLVRQVGDHRLILSLDISELEAREQDMTLTVVGLALTLLLILGPLAAWGASRLVGPLARMANQIGQLRPDRQGQRLDIPAGASAELEVIGDALNGYLARNDHFVERERLFVDMASHELRTPIAVIAGAADLASQADGVSPPVQVLLERIRSTARGVQELISMLLVLAKDPARLRQADERIVLAGLLLAIVDDHRHLAEHKDLVIRIDASSAVEIVAPLQIVRVAIGNLLRNAIEHSDRGEIAIRTEAPATVVIQDPGHGMSPEEISAAYARIARGGGERGGSGIGLDLIARLCEHLEWSLQIESDSGQGTTTTLRMGPRSGESQA
ncbi:MAG TPA: HAMP domain-containing sensor histidine kinase [Thermomonas sp.]|nr:HAMP domain-containing sensor histidine kinase [Thermomonas sp.]